MFSAGHSRSIDLIKFSASAFRCAQLPRVMEALNKVYRSVSMLSIVAMAVIT